MKNNEWSVSKFRQKHLLWACLSPRDLTNSDCSHTIESTEKLILVEGRCTRVIKSLPLTLQMAICEAPVHFLTRERGVIPFIKAMLTRRGEKLFESDFMVSLVSMLLAIVGKRVCSVYLSITQQVFDRVLDCFPNYSLVASLQEKRRVRKQTIHLCKEKMRTISQRAKKKLCGNGVKVLKPYEKQVIEKILKASPTRVPPLYASGNSQRGQIAKIIHHGAAIVERSACDEINSIQKKRAISMHSLSKGLFRKWNGFKQDETEDIKDTLKKMKRNNKKYGIIPDKAYLQSPFFTDKQSTHILIKDLIGLSTTNHPSVSGIDYLNSTLSLR